MEFDKRHSYLIQWLIGIGDLVVLNIMFIVVYMLLGSFYTKAIAYNIREVLLLLNFCYFCRCILSRFSYINLSFIWTKSFSGLVV